MLELARKHQKSIGDKLGYHNVEFRRGKIQDLKTNLELVEQYLQAKSGSLGRDLAKLKTYQEQISHEQPLIADESIDVIVSNCVLNLVRPEDKKQLFAEMYRVLKRGGRVAISDIVSDEAVPEHLAKDPDLWSACVSGAFQEEEFLASLRRRQISRHPDRRAAQRSLSDRRGHRVPRHHGDRLQRQRRALHRAQSGGDLPRPVEASGRRRWPHVGARRAHGGVRQDFQVVFHKRPTPDQFILVPPRQEVALENAGVFDCSRDHKRHPRETKGDGVQRHEDVRPVLRAGFQLLPVKKINDN